MSNERNIEWITVNDVIIPEDDQLRGRTIDVAYPGEIMEFPEVSIEKVEQVRIGLEKTAQHRSFLQKLHEKFNLPRAAGEAFSSNYQEQMRLLRDIDDSIRKMAANIKPSLGLAKQALKQRRYLDIVHFIGNINDNLRAIANERYLLKKALNHHLEDFYGDYEHADLGREYFRKNAGIMDWFQDNSRRKAGKLFEKMYENVLKERKRAVNQLYDELAVLVGFTMETLKDLGTYRARGDIGSYVGDLDKLAKKRDVFEVKFKQVYDTYIKPMIDKIKQEQAEKEEAFGNVMPAPVEKQVKPQIEVKPKEVKLQTPSPGNEDYGYGDEPAWPERPSEMPPEEVLEPEAVAPAPAVKTPPEVKPAASPQAIEIVTQDAPGTKEEYELPAWALAPLPAAQNVPVTEVTRDDKGKAVNVRRKLPMQAEEIIITLMKSGSARHLVKEALLAYSEEYDEMGDVEGSLMCLAAAEDDLENAEAYDKEQKFEDNHNLYEKIMNNDDLPVTTQEVFLLNDMRNDLLHELTKQNRKPTDDERNFLEKVDKAWAQEDNRKYGKMSEEQLEDAVLRGAMRDANRNNEIRSLDFHPSIKGLSTEDLSKKYNVPQIHYENKNGSWQIKIDNETRPIGVGTSKKDALVSATAYYWLQQTFTESKKTASSKNDRMDGSTDYAAGQDDLKPNKDIIAIEDQILKEPHDLDKLTNNVYDKEKHYGVPNFSENDEAYGKGKFYGNTVYDNFMKRFWGDNFKLSDYGDLLTLNDMKKDILYNLKKEKRQPTGEELGFLHRLSDLSHQGQDKIENQILKEPHDLDKLTNNVYDKFMHNDKYKPNNDDFHILNEVNNDIRFKLKEEKRQPTDEESRFFDKFADLLEIVEGDQFGGVVDDRAKEYIQRGEMRDQIKARIRGADRPVFNGVRGKVEDIKWGPKGELHNGWDFHPQKGLNFDALRNKYGPTEPIKIKQENGKYQVIVNNKVVGIGKTERSALNSAMSYYWS